VHGASESDRDESALARVFGHRRAYEVAERLLIDPTALGEVDRPRCFRVEAGVEEVLRIRKGWMVLPCRHLHELRGVIVE
jgi:hypothetical protein